MAEVTEVTSGVGYRAVRQGGRHVVWRIRAGRYQVVGAYRDAAAAGELRDVLIRLADREA